MCRLAEKWDEEIQKKNSEVEDANTAESAAPGDDTMKTATVAPEVGKASNKRKRDDADGA